MDNYWDRKKCTCEDCGKQFRKGDEGDNERFCLRCDHASRRALLAENGEDYEPDDWEDYDYVFGDA